MKSLGMIEVEGVAGIIVAADAACKVATVELAGWESIGGFTTVFVRGSVSDVQIALQAGAAAAGTITDHVVHNALLQPETACLDFIGFPLDTGADANPVDALGLVETRGYGVHVENNDRMVKAADVQLLNVLTVHNRVVCSLVTGELGAVERAIESCRDALGQDQWFMGSAVLSKPQVDVLRAFGQAPLAEGAS
ncbi:MAG: BMC domain-containing protein [Gemmatimonadetes bacterium]|nr:BMC domain-containing protein [Gemmatimonadota bacterium]MBT7862603.1 BMC domain-containing protein [Gemmatimonadota bacterium]